MSNPNASFGVDVGSLPEPQVLKLDALIGDLVMLDGNMHTIINYRVIKGVESTQILLEIK